jgi:hypothetical protein
MRQLLHQNKRAAERLAGQQPLLGAHGSASVQAAVVREIVQCLAVGLEPRGCCCSQLLDAAQQAFPPDPSHQHREQLAAALHQLLDQG